METWQSNHILFRQWVVDAKVFLKKLQHFGAHLQSIPIVQSTLRSIPFWQLNLKKVLILCLIYGRMSSPNTESNIVVTCVGFNIRVISDNHCNQVTWHGYRSLKIIPFIIWYSFTSKMWLLNYLILNKCWVTKYIAVTILTWESFLFLACLTRKSCPVFGLKWCWIPPWNLVRRNKGKLCVHLPAPFES